MSRTRRYRHRPRRWTLLSLVELAQSLRVDLAHDRLQSSQAIKKVGLLRPSWCPVALPLGKDTLHPAADTWSTWVDFVTFDLSGATATAGEDFWRIAGIEMVVVIGGGCEGLHVGCWFEMSVRGELTSGSLRKSELSVYIYDEWPLMTL